MTTVTLPANLVKDASDLLHELSKFSAYHHDCLEMLARINDALDEQPTATEPAQVIELPRVPERETATAIEAHVANVLAATPPPVSASIYVNGEHWQADDYYSAPQLGTKIKLEKMAQLFKPQATVGAWTDMACVVDIIYIGGKRIDVMCVPVERPHEGPF